MRNTLLACFCVFAAMGCGFLSNLGNKNGSNNPSEGTTASPEAKPTASPSVAETKPSPPKASMIPLLKKSAGKYPYEIKLLDNAELKDRLTKLLGKDFAAMKAHWNVETPMEIEGEIFKASACEAHNCGANNYVVFVDMNGDNINVFHIEDSRTKHYFEKGEIKLPSKFAKELAPDN